MQSKSNSVANTASVGCHSYTYSISKWFYEEWDIIQLNKTAEPLTGRTVIEHCNFFYYFILQPYGL